MWLLIDDYRELGCDVLARNAKAGKDMLRRGDWECVALDHDLGGQETGYDVLVWAIENGFLPSKVQLVSSNPVGVKRMQAALVAEGYSSNDGINYAKT